MRRWHHIMHDYIAYNHAKMNKAKTVKHFFPPKSFKNLFITLIIFVIKNINFNSPYILF